MAIIVYCALDVDISSLEDTIFFLGGSYKYAQGGEGLCFMTLPKNCKLRPVYTGWFADFEGLTSSSDTVNYTDNGFRFMGATLDITAFYRFNAVWSHFFSEGLSVSTFDQYIKTLMKKFIQLIGEDQFYLADLSKIGHFLTLKCQSQDEASTLFHQLKDKGVLTDYRNASLRFGFGPYLTQKDVEKACAILTSLRKS
jgi:selenocysteine lyase/cysteine desulfurase